MARIDNVRVIRDKKMNVGKGFGYVQFEEESSVSLALQLHETKLCKRKVRVERCVSDIKEKKDNQSGTQAKRLEKGDKSDKGGKRKRPVEVDANGKKIKRARWSEERKLAQKELKEKKQGLKKRKQKD